MKLFPGFFFYTPQTDTSMDTIQLVSNDRLVELRGEWDKRECEVIGQDWGIHCGFQLVYTEIVTSHEIVEFYASCWEDGPIFELVIAGA